jgi:hypothetical protein
VAEWSDYQEEVAELFLTLGLTAETNIVLQGVRTSHDVDVVVRSRHAGFEILWLVECKAWKARVPKEKVFALRAIVDDLGADRGFLMAENGYQSGALEAARQTNITLTSLAYLRETLSHDIGMAQLRSLAPRIADCRNRYWAIGKYDRIDHGLRPDVLAFGYSGDHVIQAVEFMLQQAMLDRFPIAYDRTLAALSSHGGGWDEVEAGNPNAIATPSKLFEVLNAETTELERKLDAAEKALAKRDRKAKLTD